MTIKQKAREIADKAAHFPLPTSETAARLGIIEGRRQAFEEAALLVESHVNAVMRLREMSYAKNNAQSVDRLDARLRSADAIAKSIRALIEEQKV